MNYKVKPTRQKHASKWMQKENVKQAIKCRTQSDEFERNIIFVFRRGTSCKLFTIEPPLAQSNECQWFFSRHFDYDYNTVEKKKRKCLYPLHTPYQWDNFLIFESIDQILRFVSLQLKTGLCCACIL